METTFRQWVFEVVLIQKEHATERGERIRIAREALERLPCLPLDNRSVHCRALYDAGATAPEIRAIAQLWIEYHEWRARDALRRSSAPGQAGRRAARRARA